ncbi:MAG: tRNA (N6-isopentenyl adenosine(37)-C2)-methylthiotransferase MiaB [Alphaproteobacteria bacterium]|nr:tRNA (N6-isopentenyl adenosine(37)-C2)-methylthiotransferase MiaB [Alphaproteobacteria bacterium]
MKFFIKNYGCQMNLYDSEIMTDILSTAGYIMCDNVDEADILLFNTCSIREKADEKLFSDLGRAKSIKFKKQDLGKECLIIVCGCVAQAKASTIFERVPYVDAVLGPQEIGNIAIVVNSLLEQRKNNEYPHILMRDLNTRNKFATLKSTQITKRGFSEFLTIQEGCNNFCTYCVVPYTRGREFSRDAKDIINEAKRMISLGVKEITLLGQNVNSYNGEGTDGKTWSLDRLLYAMAEIDGLVRLKYITSNPKDITENIAKAHRDIDILVPFLHLPIQSGSDFILKKMNRKYSTDKYLYSIDLLRQYRADMAFSSDFIVGFPEESDKDFEDTLKIADKVRFAQAYSFKYSPREGTMAAKMNNQVPEKIKSERLEILQNILNNHQNEFNRNTIGKTVSVLFTKYGKFKNQLVGRSEYSQAVSICDSSIKIGDIAHVKITDIKSHSLVGIIEKK